MKRIINYLMLVFVAACLPQISFAQAKGGEIKRPVKTTTTTIPAKQKSNGNTTKQRASTSGSSSFSNRAALLAQLESDMVYVEGGTYQMGSTDGYDDEKPVHQVTLSNFYICKYEVTQELWMAVMGSNPSDFKGNKRPVESVSWNDCQTFITKLNQLTGKSYRLPTEAEWEFAARGGNKSQGYKYSGSNTIGDVAWYNDNSGDKTHDVGTKAPNELGIYDMSGNVWEWCQDWYSKDYYSSSPLSNPIGPSSGSHRVRRGGGWYYNAWSCRVSNRDDFTPGSRYGGLGLRLVL